MGSNISFVNKTEFPINISLKQISPLYYKNELQPGEELCWKVGKVWFTIEVKISNGNNLYKLEDVIVPVAAFSLTTIFAAATITVAATGTKSTVSSLGRAASSAAGSTASKATTTMVNIAKVATTATNVVKTASTLTSDALKMSSKITGAIEETSVPHALHWKSQMMGDYAISSKGWYMYRDRCFEIRGGPRFFEVEYNGSMVKIMDESTRTNPLILVEITEEE